MLAVRTGRRSFDEALSIASPPILKDSIEQYVAALPPDELRIRVQRGVKNMDGAERTQLAMHLGREVSVHPLDDVSGAVSASELHSLVDRTEDLPSRFADFVRENPRAAAALGFDATSAILSAVEASGGFEAGAESSRRQFPLKSALLVLAAVAVAIVPLFAEYAHQRGLLDEIANVSPIAMPFAHPAVHLSRKTLRRAPVRAVAHHRVQHAVKIAAVAPRRRARSAHAIKHPHRAVRVARRTTVATAPRSRKRRVAAVWKFDPARNPYTHVTVAVPGNEPVAEEKARLLVKSYLLAIQAGDTASALQHLGLPANAPPANITESSIITPGATVAVIGANDAGNGATRVEARINGSRGIYNEFFTIEPDGPAQRIADRYFVPAGTQTSMRRARKPWTKRVLGWIGIR